MSAFKICVCPQVDRISCNLLNLLLAKFNLTYKETLLKIKILRRIAGPVNIDEECW